jgi:putative membrane protein
MMFWHDHGVSGWGWAAMSVSMVLFWALIITAAVLLFRAYGRSQDHPRGPASPVPEQILAERFARGEIDEEEYRGRLAALHGAGGGPRR